MFIRPFETADEKAVISLWHRCALVRPANDPKKDIQRKLRITPELFLVGIWNEAIVATVMVGYEGHRGWINYLGVAPEYRRKGWGRLLMNEAERRLRNLGCPKINLQVLSSNVEAVAFYRRLGYIDDEVVSMGKRLEVDHPGSDPFSRRL
jgi:ribosomal protein S18 acetylase RimI-like enzyme